MDNQKDNSKTGLNSYGHSNVPDIKSLVNKPIYKYVSEKTEKLVTALYMVTDCMDTDDALKNKIRFLSVELLSDMYKLSASSPLDNRTHISASVARIYEVLSLVDIACTIGFISEMNTSILKKELDLLIVQLQPKQTSDNPFAFTLDESMFAVDLPVREQISRGHVIKDTSKRTEYMSFTKKPLHNNINSISKEERTNKILNIIKDKNSLPGNESGVSIKDISSAFPDYSEKTVQRELNSLVSKSQIKKIGAKRWSRYQAL